MQAQGDIPDGLDLLLSEGKPSAPAHDRSTLAPATKLAPADTATLLSRAKSIAAQASDKQDFALRERSTPPPRAGEVIKASFPAAPSSLLPPAANATEALTVLRGLPEGEVPVAPNLSVTFSSPMVAVTSQGDAAKVQPVKLTPQPAGAWRWLGTRTILFDPKVRFPAATTYQVEVPAGTKDVAGKALAKTHAFTFTTPPPSIRSSYPGGGTYRLDEPMFIAFDQQIDAATVIDLVQVKVNNKTYAVRALTEAERADKRIKAHIDLAEKNEQHGRWVAFRTKEALPPASNVRVSLPAGLPSAEGPNKTKAEQGFDFETFPALRVEEARCSWSNTCPPLHPFSIRFNNGLDEELFTEGQVTVAPAIPGLVVEARGNYVTLRGRTTANTKYTVSVAAGIKDEFGQTLGKAATYPWVVTSAEPVFHGPDHMVVLDPLAAKPTLDIFTTNYDALKVRLYRVTPADYKAYLHYVQNMWNRDKPPTMPGQKVFDGSVPTSKGKDLLVETHVDLSRALTGGVGHVVVIAEPSPWKEQYEPPRSVVWVQATKLGVQAHIDNQQLVVYASDLQSGKPAADVALKLNDGSAEVVSDGKGVARMPLAPTGAGMLTATRGQDVAFVTDGNRWGENNGGYWRAYSSRRVLAWHVTDDRKLYKPNEEVHLKGWLRYIDHAVKGDVVGVGKDISTVTYEVFDDTGNKLTTGSAPLSAVGTFDTKFVLPKTPNLGQARVTFTASNGAGYTHYFQIEEFRRPEFEVSAASSQGPHHIGAGADVTVSAKYFAGGPLANAAANWVVSASETSYTPPNRDEFTFGKWTPWWGWHEMDMDRPQRGRRGGRGGGGKNSWEFIGKTDAIGSHILHLDFLSAKPAVPMSVVANAAVMDVNRQAWNASATMLVHPALRYVGVKALQTFVERGTPYKVELVGVDLDGKATPGVPIEVEVVRKVYKYAKGKYTEEKVDLQTCRTKAEEKNVSCEFATKEGGTYELVASIRDEAGRLNQTTLTFWVAGEERPAEREVKQENVQLIPNKKEYAAGEVAELLVQAPFAPAEGIVSWRRSGIYKYERISLAASSTIVKVPVTEDMVPNLHVQVDLVGEAYRASDKGEVDKNLPKRVAYASGLITVQVPPRARTLAVSATPKAAKLGPGDRTTIALEVKDAAGQPVANAEAAVIVVDEAILALAGHQFANPLAAFYPHRNSDTNDVYSRADVKLTNPLSIEPEAVAQGLGRRGEGPGGGGGIAEEKPMEMEDGVAESAAMPASAAPPPPPPPPAPSAMRAAPAKKMMKADLAMTGSSEGKAKAGKDTGGAIAIRSDFNPLAVFSPAVVTGADGRATVEVKLPDNLTRYRVVALAAAGDKQFGKGESAITARLPLMVRMSPPRFLNFGDAFELPVVVQNQTDEALTVKLAARATNAAFTDGDGRVVKVPANDRVEVRFPAAAEMAGTARLQVVGASGAYSDASELALPVWTPVTTEAFATYGVIDQGAVAQPVALPGEVVLQFGGLEVTTASTNLQSLTDAMLYLVSYPFECAEQRASRILGIAALRDVLTAFKVEGMPTPAAMEARVASDLERLTQMQNGDGGFAFWERGRPSWPYLTVHVLHAMARAKAKGYEVPGPMWNRALAYVREVESHYDSDYPPTVRWTISAYALAVRALAGDMDVAKAQRLLSEATVKKLPMEAVAWLLRALAGQKAAEAERATIVRHVMNNVSETAGAANFVTSYADGGHLLLASDHRVDGLMLEALIAEQPKSDLIPKVVTGLLAHRKKGRWLNTSENVFALLALDQYFRTYEKVTPNFVARVWLGEAYAGEHAFKGRTTEYHQISIPMREVAAHDKQNLVLQKDGAGRMYYRVGMNYAPKSLKLDPADYGFVIERRYEGVDKPDDVQRLPDGSWQIKAGARVRVVISMVNENRRYHVALVDPLPAGLEPLNPNLATTEPVPERAEGDATSARRRGYWWWGPWYEHQNMRDERVEAFTSLLWEGVHEYSYVARATTPGNFVVPPTKAEEMYMPETFGRAGSDRVIVK